MKKIIILAIFLICIMSNTYASSELKGVWVASVYNLDYPLKPTTNSEILKKETIQILDNVKKMGLNAVFLQVRPSADALYNSKLFPYSKYLTGENGLKPNNNFDPLKFWIEEAHKREIELHAWINPYRITKKGEEEFREIDKNSPAKLNPNYIIKHSDGNYYFNPGMPGVRKLVIDGALEIINNYNVDGIHMDDYFYPGTDFNDKETYNKYKGKFTNIDDWRRNNVDLLVKEMGEEIKKVNKNIKFGISPFGIWANSNKNTLGSNTNGTESYYSHYADTRKWALNEWIDYIAPQIYWERGHKSADYITLVNWWSDTLKDSKTKLYIGLADYRSCNAKNTSVWYNGNEIDSQMEINKNNYKISGEIHYRYSSLLDSNKLQEILKRRYSKDEISVIVNNNKLDFEVKPFIENNRTLVPLRAIFEALGAEVNWKNQTVIAKKDNIIISLKIDENKMRVNDEIVRLDAKAKIKNNRTFVPLRAISEAFNNDVNWDGYNKIITIK